MILQTHVDIRKSPFGIEPSDRLLFVGSCFADNIGARFRELYFNATVNPYGVMYNPASVLHTVQRQMADEAVAYDVVVFTLGTNHVYILNETGEIVDNCQKRPQKLFTEKVLTVEECKGYLGKAIALLRQSNPEVKVVITVSPIRYQKYGFHESQLSKATLLLAADSIVRGIDNTQYFPAYELMNDELRDYRFYNPDMLHPSQQAVDYIFQRFSDTFFSNNTIDFTNEGQKIRKALAHRPLNPDSEETKAFVAKAKNDEKTFLERWRL